MAKFEELIESRKAWIEQVLRPWCVSATRVELLKAEQEWTDIAGRAGVEFTLWPWVWSRFPILYVEGMSGINETHKVQVTLESGHAVSGFPDSRESQRGQLVLLGDDGHVGPYSIDSIVAIEQVDS
ncbi:MAG: hypothetical protein KDA69_08070 [Planctomycetaceae bacterium]|nr:hypothetical protein [Planctomycetaceae bacterium]